MSPMVLTYGALGLAISLEVAGTALLARSEQFTRIVPTVLMALLYAGSFYFLSHALKSLPLGVAYAIWAGLGIVLTAIVGIAVFRQVPDLPAMIGIAMIVAGVVVVNVFSGTGAH